MDVIDDLMAEKRDSGETDSHRAQKSNPAGPTGPCVHVGCTEGQHQRGDQEESQRRDLHPELLDRPCLPDPPEGNAQNDRRPRPQGEGQQEQSEQNIHLPPETRAQHDGHQPHGQ